MKLTEIKSLSEAADQTIDASLVEISSFVKHTMQDLEQEYKHEEASTSSVSAAPDTTKFRAIKYGMIEYAPNTIVHGSYGSSTKYNHFFKMGSTVASGVQKEIRSIFVEQFEDEFGHELNEKIWTAFNTSDGVRVVFTPDEGGSAWSGFGFSYKRA